MKVHLLYPDRDAPRDGDVPEGADDLVADLDLEPVLAAMVPGRQLERLCPAVLLNPLTDPEPIRWRQQILADVLADPSGMQQLFELAGKALESQRGAWLWSGRTADSALSRAVHALAALLPWLRQLAALATAQLAVVRSPGLRQLHQRLVDDLDAGYLQQVRALLEQLSFPAGVTARTRIAEDGMLGKFEVLAPRGGRRPWWAVLGFNPPGRLHFTLAERDEAGARALTDLHNDLLHEIAAVAAQANEHVVGFFRQLQWEAGFYVGCRQLHDKLRAAGIGICWPDPVTAPPDAGSALDASGLAPLNLAIRSGRAPVGNDLSGPVPLLVITGANQGGKTTFLRSLGIAQLLLQAGMFVPAASFSAGLVGAVHSHFRRAEDEELRSGKLDEELARMSTIVDRVRPGDLVLMNESFAATDEVEGSWIAADIIDALLAHGVRALLVTHFHALAQHYRERPGTVFLRAERLPDGSRSHRLVPGAPNPTSHGMDLFDQLFAPPTSGG
ncbi:MAG: hypothetical protein QM804_13820 [Propionicimonas sp.]